MAVALTLMVTGFWGLRGSAWTRWDYQILDLFFQKSVRDGRGPEINPRISLITLTEETKGYFGQTILDRTVFADINNNLEKLNIQAAAYDIIFVLKSNATSDTHFKNSLNNLKKVYLPIGLNVDESAPPFKLDERIFFDRIKPFIGAPMETGTSDPFVGSPYIMQYQPFFEEAHNTGHINIETDADGVYRQFTLLIKADSGYLPALALSIFLDYSGVPLEKVDVHWGEEMRIPALPGSRLKKDVVIPIDHRGRTYIPFVQFWEEEQRNFKQVPIHYFLTLFEDPDARDKLNDFFKDNFVFIGDVSLGSKDIGQTPLEDRVPLMTLQAAILNGLLNNTFYAPWTFTQTLGLVVFIAVLLCLAALPKSSWYLYGCGGILLLALIGWTWHDFIHFRLFPLFSVMSSTLFLFVGFIGGLQVFISREQQFIQSAFAKYVPEKVVKQLMERPELLQKSGEERFLTVLFSDLENFTAISEKMTPTTLVSLLNEYLTDMTNIILEEGGIIDKYHGDAIMAEFGAPLPMDHHEDHAVMAGLKMQSRLAQLRESWAAKGYPQLYNRIGINSGLMVVGNMGSQSVFDYTVIGDSVNLASRLEGANKKYGTYFMISEFTYERLTPGTFRTRILDVIKVMGKSEAVKVYEVYGLASDVLPSDRLHYYQTYAEGFESFLLKRFEDARKQFHKALSIQPQDPAATGMMERIDNLPSPLPKNWDGSISLDSK